MIIDVSHLLQSNFGMYFTNILEHVLLYLRNTFSNLIVVNVMHLKSRKIALKSIFFEQHLVFEQTLKDHQQALHNVCRILVKSAIRKKYICYL